jgi:hypothetical protein
VQVPNPPAERARYEKRPSCPGRFVVLTHPRQVVRLVVRASTTNLRLPTPLRKADGAKMPQFGDGELRYAFLRTSITKISVSLGLIFGGDPDAP